MATTNWRTINIDALDPDGPANFDISTLTPGILPVSTADVQSLGSQIRQLLRGGDSEGALRSALENAPYGADAKGKELHAGLVVEILQSIRQAEMSPLVTRIYQSQGGTELLDVLVKYLYKGMSMSAVHAVPSYGTNSNNAAGGRNLTPQGTGAGFSQVSPRSFGGAGGAAGEGGGQAMSVLLSWHEKVVEIAGLGSVVRCMSDRRTV